MSVKQTVLGLLLSGLVMWTTADPVAPPVLPRMGIDAGPVSEAAIRRLVEAVETLQHENADIRQKYVDIQRENVDIKQWMENKAESDSSQLAAGAVYVRWGRTVCEGDATILYVGYAAGPMFSNPAGGHNTLCLPEFPEWGTFTETVETTSSSIYGVEYQLDNTTGSPFSTRNNYDVSLMNNDAPCVVCHTSTRQVQIMIPAKRTCPNGWTAEYWGYLVSASTVASHLRTSAVCLDEAPQSVAAGSPDSNPALWYPIQSRCGAMPCPGYYEGRELACVVCTQ